MSYSEGRDGGRGSAATVMDPALKRLIRAVVRRVHPDLFTTHVFERQRNQDSLKTLNNYVERVARGAKPRSTTVEFWVKDNEQLTRIEALLPSTGSLGPLFYAFGLITEAELAAGTGATVTDTNFLEWLRDTVGEAVRLGEQHETTKMRIRKARDSVEAKFALLSLHVGSEFASGPLEQRRQLEALEVLDEALGVVSTEGFDYSGLHVHVYHPEGRPLGGMDPSSPEILSGYVCDDGCVHVVAEPEQLVDTLRTLDLARARVLTKVTMFWLRRVQDLTPVLRELLRVEHVWCDTNSEQNSQNFVLWAGYLLEQREEIGQELGDRRFTFSILVHSDPGSPMVDFGTGSSILQVRSDCPPRTLLEFLLSDSAAAADAAAADVVASRAEEAALLEAIRSALGAKHVVRVCSVEGEAVLDGARRLLDAANMIKEVVDLRGASLALDDCYEVWGSGFISIPYDFELKELQPQLVRLLGAGGAAGQAGGMQGHWGLNDAGPGHSNSSNGSSGDEQSMPQRSTVAAYAHTRLLHQARSRGQCALVGTRAPRGRQLVPRTGVARACELRAVTLRAAGTAAPHCLRL